MTDKSFSMTEKIPEKLLSAEIPTEICDNFLNQADLRGFKKKRALAAAAKLWYELPSEIQQRLLDQSLDSSAFLELVQQIVDERIAAGCKIGKANAARQRKKQQKRG